MRTPIRKPGKYTHLENDPHITEAKFNELKNKLERLKKSQPNAIEETARLAAHGDFSENAGYQTAKAWLRGINKGIDELTEKIKHAIIIKPDKRSQVVQLGNLVTIQTGTTIKTYQILGSAETDPTTGVISHLSPIGQALIGHRVGDVIKVKLVQRIIEYKITKIE